MHAGEPMHIKPCYKVYKGISSHDIEPYTQNNFSLNSKDNVGSTNENTDMVVLMYCGVSFLLHIPISAVKSLI